MVRAWLGFAAMVGACAGGGPAPDAPTWHGQVRAIVDQHCVECHVAGGIGPMDFTRAEDWADGPAPWAAAAVASIEAGSMPPWRPSDDCEPLANSRALAAEERDLIARWAAADFPVGDPSEYVPSDTTRVDPLADLGPPDRVVRPPVAYTPRVETPDDYRCFVVDPSVAEDTWVRGLRFAPDAVSIVHHAILYRLDGSYASLVDDLEAADPEPGYTCFGSPGTWDTDTLAAWAPGQVPERYPDGVARPIDQGSILILQLHYNVLNVDAASMPSDRTALELWTLPPGEEPPRSLISIPFANQGIRIPAGEPDHVEVDRIRLNLPDGLQLEALGVMPHMHQLGTRIRLDRVHEDDTRSCVFAIDDWDFNWQQTYTFPEDALYAVDGAVRFELTCAYDNSAANQPVVNGQPREPVEVRWGDGSYDEMCLMYVNALVPTAFR